MSRRQHPTPAFGDMIANLRAAGGWPQALRGLARNTWTKTRRVDNCCGDYGAPGC